MTLKLSPLNDVHVVLGAKLIEFSGWSLPVQYTSIIDEHVNTRENAGLFDISHMGEFLVTGKDAFDFLQYVCVNDVSLIKPGGAQYSTICYENGTVVDDLFYYMYTKEKFKIIVNASNKDKDFAWLKSCAKKFKNVAIDDQSAKRSRVALQGPKAQDILQKLVKPDLNTLKRFQFIETDVGRVPAFIARTGYTGEDGFEVSFPVDRCKEAWNAIMDAGKQFHLMPVGLGARDTMRLEACYSLYGDELTDEITPVEAGIEFIIKQAKQADYIGKKVLVDQLIKGTSRKIVALKALDKNIFRHGNEIFDEKGIEKIGIVTSGTYSPTFKVGIGLGFVDAKHNILNATVMIKVRDKLAKVQIVNKPFYAYHPRK
nr:glycine cleavage system aminomethyltransferase GcvT [Candidatus Sigynarchaeota archaeon]